MGPLLRFGECNHKIVADSFLCLDFSGRHNANFSFRLGLLAQFCFWSPPVIENQQYLHCDLIDPDRSFYTLKGRHSFQPNQ